MERQPNAKKSPKQPQETLHIFRRSLRLPRRASHRRSPEAMRRSFPVGAGLRGGLHVSQAGAARRKFLAAKEKPRWRGRWKGKSAVFFFGRQLKKMGFVLYKTGIKFG